MDELINQAKEGKIQYYNESKFRLEIECQEVLEELRKKNKKTKGALKQFEYLIEENKNIMNEAMKSINDSFSAHEFINKRHIQSTIYFKRTEVRWIESDDDQNKEETMDQDEEEAKKNVVGVFVHANWFLSANQLNFIKLKLLKNNLTKDIQLSFDQVKHH